jgi:protein involved in ribonucleotide reduction
MKIYWIKRVFYFIWNELVPRGTHYAHVLKKKNQSGPLNMQHLFVAVVSIVGGGAQDMHHREVTQPVLDLFPVVNFVFDSLDNARAM